MGKKEQIEAVLAQYDGRNPEQRQEALTKILTICHPKSFLFDGCDYDHKTVAEFRQNLTELRDEALKQNEFGHAVNLSHTIAAMSLMAEWLWPEKWPVAREAAKPTDDDEMSLGEALQLLAEVHTREDSHTGYVVDMGAVPPWPYQKDYVQAWGVLRARLGMPSAPPTQQI